MNAGFLRWLEDDVASAVRLLAGTIEAAGHSDDPERLVVASHHALYVGDDDAAYRLNERVVAGARAAGAATDLLFALGRLVQVEIGRAHV